MQSKYTYTLEGENLKMDYEGQGKIVLTWAVKIDGDKMTMDNSSDADQKFWLDRKK